MRPRRLVMALSLTMALVLCGAAVTSAQDGLFVEASAELSPVQISTYEDTWRVGRLTAGWQEPGRFGLSASAERHQRSSLVDWAFRAQGFRRLGAWTIGGAAGYADVPAFLYQRSFEAVLSRRVIGGLVLEGGYRHLDLPVGAVRILEPGASWYFARGDFGARVFVVDHGRSQPRSTVVLVRSLVDVAARVAVGGGVAAGARIFDVDALGRGASDAWQAFGLVRVAASAHATVELQVGSAHEDPLFSQQTLGTRVRWTF